MGKLKEAIINQQENLDAMRRIYQKSNYSHGNPRNSETIITEPSDQELAQWDLEFNAWLDAYEASFGDYL
jgi:hypothetical protein